MGRVALMVVFLMTACSSEIEVQWSKKETPPPAEKQDGGVEAASSESQADQAELPAGRVLHTEFQSEDAKATGDFLGAMFELTPREAPTPMGPLYSFEVGDTTSFAVRSVAGHERGPGTTVYFATEDLDQALAQAEELGATIIVPKMPVPGKGSMAWIEVPGGVRLALLEPAASE